MVALAEKLLGWFSDDENGMTTILVVSFLSATLLPMGSEPVLATFVKLNPDQFWPAIAVAIVGNTGGGVVTYWLGLGAHEAIARGKRSRHLGWFERFGPKVLFFSFLPAIGDPLCAVAGWLRLPFWRSVFWMALGKTLRYIFMTAAIVWIPDSFWRTLWPFD
jgi:membrane protein YqaA with SNARE-associated domain